MTEADIIKFFNGFFSEKVQKSVALPQSGSSRKNFILENSEDKFVVTANDNIVENRAFFYFSEVFSDLNLNTPKIFTINTQENLYIQSFLGSETLSEIIAKEGESDRLILLVKKTLSELYELQKATQDKIDFAKAFEYESYNELPVLNDLFYFKNFFADVLELSYQKSRLISEFLELTKMLANLSPRGLMLRDFQARNIMVNEEKVFFIDYQAAMEGPLMYDVISFLYQAKANFTENFKNEMLQYYFNLWQDENIENQLKKSVKPLQLIRFLQVLGAYGFRGLVQKKSHFIASIPKGIENIQKLSNSWDEMEKFPELKKLIQTLKFKS